MPTLTRFSGLRGILDDLPPRGLPIPVPPGRREQVVTDALKGLAKAHKADHEKAEETIEKYGLTIEVARLRDKLARGATTDLQRLLLSTPGVPEKLFNDAVDKQLKEEEQQRKRDEDDVKDESVGEIVDQLGEVVKALKKLVLADPKGGGGGAPVEAPASAEFGGDAGPTGTALAADGSGEDALTGQPDSGGTDASSKDKKS